MNALLSSVHLEAGMTTGEAAKSRAELGRRSVGLGDAMKGGEAAAPRWGVSTGSVSQTTDRARETELTYEVASELPYEELETRLCC